MTHDWAVAIYLTRRSHLKTLSPVIDAALRRYHDEDVVLVCDPQAAKKGDELKRREVETLWPQAVIERSVPVSTAAVVGLTLPPADGSRRVLVDPFFDFWLKPLRPEQVYHSAFHKGTHEALWQRERGAPVVGWLPGDQANDVVVHQFRLRTMALFFTLKLDVPEPWRKSRKGLAEYRRVYEQARDKARNEGLAFVVKSRAKNKDPRWVWKDADEYVLDEQMVPYTSLSLLARSKWCVHFESGAALEAALMGCYGYVIRVPQGHVENMPGGEHIYWRQGGDPPRLHQWPGVTEYGAPWAHFDRMNGRTLDRVARAAYLQHFVGDVDGHVADRILDVAEGK